MTELQPGARGWIAHDGGEPLEVEFVGYDSYDPDYPLKPTAYFRALSSLPDTRWSSGVDVGRIVDETQREGDETVLHPTREGAVREALATAEGWAKRRRDDDAEKQQRVERLRTELATLTSDSP